MQDMPAPSPRIAVIFERVAKEDSALNRAHQAPQTKVPPLEIGPSLDQLTASGVPHQLQHVDPAWVARFIILIRLRVTRF